MQRRVEPELLDTLRAEDPAARRSRRELRMINAIMGNHRWLARELRRSIRPGWRVLELGAGDGAFGAQLVAGGICDPRQLIGFDLAPCPDAWPEESNWTCGDVLKGNMPEAEIVVANLFLHHFRPEALAQLGARLPTKCRILLANEPARRRLHLVQGALLSVLALLSRVTRHDMRVSIGAGFLGDELPGALGIGGWKCESSATFLGAHRLRAERP
ncbi:MAG: hypothetical protein ABIP20_04285 [Chthoniobacteraceae bacterium]